MHFEIFLPLVRSCCTAGIADRYIRMQEEREARTATDGNRARGHSTGPHGTDYGYANFDLRRRSGGALLAYNGC
jgi:hypothetical protein